MDLFNFFRYALGTVVTIYATLVTIQSLMGWYQWLSQPLEYMTILRRYVILAGLRLRLRSFLADCLICILLCVVFVMLWHAHSMVHEIGNTLADARRQFHPRPR